MRAREGLSNVVWCGGEKKARVGWADTIKSDQGRWPGGGQNKDPVLQVTASEMASERQLVTGAKDTGMYDRRMGTGQTMGQYFWVGIPSRFFSFPSHSAPQTFGNARAQYRMVERRNLMD